MPMSTKAICAQLVEVLGMVIKTCGRLVIIQNHLSMVDTYLASLPKGSSPSTIHSKKLAFMADNDIRQLGKPRIGIYADRVKPDPLHCEINTWQQILDLIYCESVRRRVFDKFIETLSALIGLSTTNPPNEEISTEHNGITESTVDVTGGVDCN